VSLRQLSVTGKNLAAARAIARQGVVNDPKEYRASSVSGKAFSMRQIRLEILAQLMRSDRLTEVSRVRPARQARPRFVKRQRASFVSAVNTAWTWGDSLAMR